MNPFTRTVTVMAIKTGAEILCSKVITYGLLVFSSLMSHSIPPQATTQPAKKLTRMLTNPMPAIPHSAIFTG